MLFCAFRLLKHVNCIHKNNIQSFCVLSTTCAVARWAALLSSWNTRSSGSSALLQNFYGSGCAHLSRDYLHSWRHGWKSWRWTEHQLLMDCWDFGLDLSLLSLQRAKCAKYEMFVIFKWFALFLTTGNMNWQSIAVSVYLGIFRFYV